MSESSTIEKPCPGCRGQGQFEYYAKMLDCGRCAGTGRVVCDVCSCCGSHLRERPLTRDEEVRATSQSAVHDGAWLGRQRDIRPE